MEDLKIEPEKDILHSHCKNCIKVTRCFVKPVPNKSCVIITCKLDCGFKFHACKADEHSLLCANEKVPCLNAGYGCPSKLLRSQQAKHLETCPASVVVCTMEWNRLPVPAREQQTSRSCNKMNPLVESQLDVALALRDQRMLKEWLKSLGTYDFTQQDIIPAVPLVSVATGAEYLCVETADALYLHTHSDASEELPEGGEFSFYYVPGGACNGIRGSTIVSVYSSFSCSAESNEQNTLGQSQQDCAGLNCGCDHQSDGGCCDNAETNEKVSEEDEVENHDAGKANDSNYGLFVPFKSVPMVTEPWHNDEEYNVIPCEMELEESKVNNSINFLDNLNVSDIFSASLDHLAAPIDLPVEVSSPSPNLDLDLDLTLEYFTCCRSRKPRDMYTFICSQEFRRDQYSMHYKNVHSDIHGGLNGWLEQRCPLAPYGCPYSVTRLYPSSRGSRVVHNNVLESFGVKPYVEIDDSNETLNIVSKDVKIGNSELDECNMDFDLSVLPIGKFGLDHFPFEVLRHIFGFLDPFSLCNVAMTCRSFRSVCATLLRERGIVVQHWQKEDDNSWKISHKTWMFGTSFTPVVSWGFEENDHMANHMKNCPFFTRNICTKPFFHLLNEEPSPKVRAKLERSNGEEMSEENKG